MKNNLGKSGSVCLFLALLMNSSVVLAKDSESDLPFYERVNRAVGRYDKVQAATSGKSLTAAQKEQLIQDATKCAEVLEGGAKFGFPPESLVTTKKGEMSAGDVAQKCRGFVQELGTPNVASKLEKKAEPVAASPAKPVSSGWSSQWVGGLSSGDCKGIASGDRSWCDTNDCKGIASGDRSWCDTNDCKGVAAKDRSWCDTSLCKAWASADRTWCDTNDCKGIASKDRSFCDSAQCKAIASGDRTFCP